MSSFAALTGQVLPPEAGPDSFDHLAVLLGNSKKGRNWIVEHALNGRLSIIKNNWKLIEPGTGEKLYIHTNTESGNDTDPQLYNLKSDIGERNNVADGNQTIVNELTELLMRIKKNELSR
jgi:hypothetical protein